MIVLNQRNAIVLACVTSWGELRKKVEFLFFSYFLKIPVLQRFCDGGNMIDRQQIASSEAGKLVEYAIKTLSGKWKWIIIGLLHRKDVLRYGELRSILEKPTDSVLSRQLRELEQDNIVLRTSYNEVPPRVEYSLTPKEKRLFPSSPPCWNGARNSKTTYPSRRWGKKHTGDHGRRSAS